MARRRSTGQALAEFAVVIPVFILMLMAIVDFGRGIYAYHTVSNAARSGARVAIVDQNATKIEARARELTISLPPADVTVDVETGACAVLKIGCPADVTVNYEWRALTPIIGDLIGPIGLASTTSMPIERVFSSP